MINEKNLENKDAAIKVKSKYEVAHYRPTDLADSIAWHEYALEGLKAKEKQLDRDYNQRGYDLAMAQRAEMDLDNVHGKAEMVAEDGSKIPSMNFVVIETQKDIPMKRLGEDLDFTKGEIVRLERKIKAMKQMLAQSGSIKLR